MRAYFFLNMYLSSIQQGIQSQHTTAELFLAYRAGHPEPKHDMLFDWAKNNKYSILLNGGESKDLIEISHKVMFDLDLPWATFREDGLEDAMTCVGVIVPSKIYKTASQLRKPPRFRDAKLMFELSEADERLAKLISDCRLAR